MFRTKKNILSKCFCFGTHGVYYFTTFVVSSSVPLQRQAWALHLIWNMLTRYNRWVVSSVDTICYVSKIKWQKKSNLMMLDHSGIDYSLMLLFVLGFLVYWEIQPNSHAFSSIRQHVVYDLILKWSHLNFKTKCDITDDNF